MEITHLRSASENTQYCLSIGMDLYTKVSRYRMQMMAKYICDRVSHGIEHLQRCNNRRNGIGCIESIL